MQRDTFAGGWARTLKVVWGLALAVGIVCACALPAHAEDIISEVSVVADPAWAGKVTFVVDGEEKDTLEDVEPGTKVTVKVKETTDGCAFVKWVAQKGKATFVGATKTEAKVTLKEGVADEDDSESEAQDESEDQAEGEGSDDGAEEQASTSIVIAATFDVPHSITVAEGIEHGTVTPSVTSARKGTKVTVTAEPAEGYELQSLTYTPEGGTATDVTSAKSLTMPAANVTLNAAFAPITYSIEFRKNHADATGTMGRQAFTYDVWQPLATNAFEREGYEFEAWNTKADGSGTSFEDGQNVQNLSAQKGDVVILFARWQKSASDDSSDDDGGSSDDGDTAEVTYATVTFDANGGTGTMEPQEVTAGQKTQLDACTFAWAGHAFTGWNTEADGSGTPVADKSSPKINRDVTLYAQWTDHFTVTFNANGGKGTMTAQVVQLPEDYVAGDKVSATLKACAFTREGYTFTKWNTSVDGSGSAISNRANVSVRRDVTLYAQWSDGSSDDSGGTEEDGQTVTVTFDANGGEGTMDDQTLTKGETVTLSECAFTNDGYSFAGWNTVADGSGTTLRDQARVKVNRDVTLYAQWTDASGDDSGDSDDAGTTAIPTMTSSAGGSYVARNAELTFTITQKIPSDATYARIWTDLDPAMAFVSSADQVVVSGKDGNAIQGANVSIDGQTLSVTIDDADVVRAQRGSTVKVEFKAKVRDDADLAGYVTSEEAGTAYIEYVANSEFQGAEGRTVTSETKHLRVRISSTTNSATKAATKTATTSTKSSTALAATADPTSMAAVVTTAMSGLALVAAGARRRR